MEELFKLDRLFKRTRQITLLALFAMAVISLTAVVMSYRNAQEYAKRIYIVDKNEQFEALTSNINDNLPVEIQYHVTRFHELFFNLSPDAQQITENTKKAFYLCDESAKLFYDNLKEQGYYHDLVQGNVVQHLTVDSVVVNSTIYPYSAVCYAHLEQTRSSGRSLKAMVSTCTLEEMPRSLHSPNGLFMRDFTVTDIYDAKPR